MKFEIPFNADILKKQTDINFGLTWNNLLKRHKRDLVICLCAIFLGILTIYGKNNIGFIFLVIGIYGILEFCKFNFAHKKAKQNYSKIVLDEISLQTEANENSIWEFNDEYFRYKDCKYDAKIKWIAFKSFRIIEDNLFLDLTVGNRSSYIIAKEEVGENYFQSIINLVEEKIKKPATNPR